MFLTSDLCYVEMHRSGSTHLVKLFEKYMPDGKKIGVHNRPDQEIYDSNRFFVGSIRNPWEWYVSLWSFGCVNKGTLYGRLTSKKVYLRNLGWRTKPILSSYIFFQQLWKPLDRWKRLYSDPQSIENFQEWLKLLFDYSRIHDVGEGFGLSSINKFSGLMTYRYLVFYSSNIKKLYDNSINSYEDLKNFDNTYNVLNYMIRNESLEENFISVLENFNIKIDDNEKKSISNLKRTKYGAWRNIRIEKFFDEECFELVKKKEKLIIDKYGYKLPLN